MVSLGFQKQPIPRQAVFSAWRTVAVVVVVTVDVDAGAEWRCRDDGDWPPVKAAAMGTCVGSKTSIANTVSIMGRHACVWLETVMVQYG